MLKYHREGTMLESMPVYIQTINIGNWKLVGLSREVVSEYGLGIKALFPDKIVSVAGYTNDVASYLPTIRHIEAGVYEGDDSYFCYCQQNIFTTHVYDKILSVAGYTNDVASYLPTIRHIEAGVYEGNESFFWYGQPNIFPDNVYDHIISAVKANNR